MGTVVDFLIHTWYAFITDSLLTDSRKFISILKNKILCLEISEMFVPNFFLRIFYIQIENKIDKINIDEN